MAEEDMSKAAFVTLEGIYKFFRMPFGMKNSDATLVHEIKMLSDMSGIESYINNLIVFFSDWRTHIETLEEPLMKLSDVNLTARVSKCIFGAPSVEFLRHEYDWITPNDDNLDKIARAKRPVAKKKV